MADHPVLYAFEEPVALVTLNRPRKFNALNAEVLEGLGSALETAEATRACRAVILTGAGRAFCWGADLAAVAGDPDADPAEAVRDLLPAFQGLVRAFAASPLPIIAAINGFATGAGLDLALACDMRVAVRGARLGEAFIGAGLVPDGGGSWVLPRLVGPGVAAEMAMTGTPIQAERAEALGLVNRAVAAADLLASARSIAQVLAERDRDAVAETKRLLRANLERTFDEALEAEAAEQSRRLDTDAFRKAVEEARKRLR